MNNLYYIIATSEDKKNGLCAWYGKNHRGYVYDIEEAGLYNKNEAIQILKQRNTDIPWNYNDIQKNIIKIIDTDNLIRRKEDNDIEEIIYNTKLEQKNEIYIIKEKEYNYSLINFKNFLIFNKTNLKKLNFKKFKKQFKKFKKIFNLEEDFPLLISNNKTKIYNDLIDLIKNSK